jgi:alpha-glucoside transport system substrate-binding protein
MLAAILFGCTGDGGPEEETPTPAPAAGSVDVLGIWENEELASFEAMVAPWQSSESAAMEFTGTRDITGVLASRVSGGDPPDVAMPAELGLFQRFAREDRLTPLSECAGLDDYVRANYPPSFVELGTVDGTLYGFFMKADSKATIFYDPGTFAQFNETPLGAGATFADLLALTQRFASADFGAWSNGQVAGGGTGFPGSDTIQQILINDAGVEVYDGVMDGSVPYTDPAVRDAWEKFGQLVLPEGHTIQGTQGVIATDFRDSATVPFAQPPLAAMVHLGGFAQALIQDEFPQSEPLRDYDVMPWPGGAVTGGANIAYAFNADDDTCSFLTHIAGAAAQEIWVTRGGFTSVNQLVSLDAYPDGVARKIAEQVLATETFRFDLDDAIGGAGQHTIFEGVIEFLQDPNALDSILERIQTSIETGEPG